MEREDLKKDPKKHLDEFTKLIEPACGRSLYPNMFVGFRGENAVDQGDLTRDYLEQLGQVMMLF